MAEDLGSYHIPEGEPKHVASVDFLGKLGEAEARLAAAREKARREAEEKAKRLALAKAAAEQEAREHERAEQEAAKHAHREEEKQHLHEVSEKFHVKRFVGTIAGGLVLGAGLIAAYEWFERGNAPVPAAIPPVQQIEAPPGASQVVPATPVPGGENTVPERGLPPGLEQQ